MKFTTPEALREERRERDRRLDQEYQNSVKARRRSALLTGLIGGLILNSIPNIVAIVTLDLRILCIILLLSVLAMLWSLIVFRYAIGVLWSVCAYGLCGMAVVTPISGFAPIWWMSVMVLGALISVINDIYRKKHLGY